MFFKEKILNRIKIRRDARFQYQFQYWKRKVVLLNERMIWLEPTWLLCAGTVAVQMKERRQLLPLLCG